MKTQPTIRRTILAMALAAFAASATAQVKEDEANNNDFLKPQALEVGSGGSITVLGTIQNPSASTPDVDYYSFQGQKGDTVTVDIDETISTDPTNPFDTVLHLFAPDGTLKAQNLDAEPVDPGSNPYAPGENVTMDANLQFTLTDTGTWRIAVTADPAYLTHQGNFVMRRAFSNGSYKLIVSGLKPAIDPIAIDIKPGNDELAPLNPKSKGVIPVALLSSGAFNPFDVNEASLKFGRIGNEASFRRCNKEGADLNGDGRPDRICHFDNEKTGFRHGDTMGIVTGTQGGKAFEGRGLLKVVPNKRGD